jgi:hypothetical protein
MKESAKVLKTATYLYRFKIIRMLQPTLWNVKHKKQEGNSYYDGSSRRSNEEKQGILWKD